jgi:hypothetical protein
MDNHDSFAASEKKRPGGHRWRLFATAISLILVGLYIGAFLTIRHRGMADYQCRLHGERPQHAQSWEAVTDGGSICHPGWGYDIWKMHRFAVVGVPGQRSQYIKGPRLVFTCRRWFPVLERWLVDQESLHTSADSIDDN